MARIDKAEHSRILQMVDGEHRKVADVAAEYGCSAAAIYQLLAKLRRAGTGAGTPADDAAADPAPTPPSDIVPVAAPVAAPVAIPMATPVFPDLFAAVAVAPPQAAASQAHEPAAADAAPPSPGLASATVTDLPRREPTPPVADKPAASKQAAERQDTGKKGAGKGTGLGAKLAKPGFGLVMRTADDEETMTPFRSLDDLLSAVKPILRAASRSSDTVWFSIQPIDLAALDSDAA